MFPRAAAAAALLAAVVALALAGRLLVAREPPNEGRAAIAGQPRLPAVELVDMHGQPARLTDGSGLVRLVFFGYSNCPDVCPLTLARLARLYRDLGEPNGLQVVMVTVDPLRDTPGRLRGYLGNFHPSFLGLTGEPSAIREAMAGFQALAQAAGVVILHTDAVALVNRRGEVVALYGQSSGNPDGSLDEATFRLLRSEVGAMLGVLSSDRRGAEPDRRE